MDNGGLIFIPDISGFTRFVNQTEIEHSRYIIEELLETIINSNQLGLKVSEIEGDAILFYKFGDPQKCRNWFNRLKRCSLNFTGRSAIMNSGDCVNVLPVLRQWI